MRSRLEARSILQKTGNDTLEGPVPLLRIAEDFMGCEVRLDDMGDVDGLCIPLPDPIIYINSRHCKARQRFSLAHELGHLALRHQPEQIGRWEIEREANIFAGELLLPVLSVKRLAYRMDYFDIAELFNVSPAAAQIRLNVLGLTPRRRSHHTAPVMEATF